MASYTVETYGELQPHLQQEWLLTNGIGGFSSSTIVGCNTRRYHGLLCAAMTPPVGRAMLLSRVGEIIVVDGRTDAMLEFSVNQFSNTFHPRGDQYLRRFDQSPGVCRWEYDVDGIVVVKTLQMCWERNAIGLRYEIDPAGRTVELRLLPFVRMLDFHALRRGQCGFNESSDEHGLSIKTDWLQLHIHSDDGVYQPTPAWWFNHTYYIEAERGQDDTEDLYSPGRFVLGTDQAASITLWADVDPNSKLDWDEQLRRRAAISPPIAGASPVFQRLADAANDIIVARKKPDGSPGCTIMAGYPWFADWGRDTMIALPGLLLVTGRFEQAKQVLSVFAQYVSQGMIPNRFDDYTDEPSYNTVDASLWFIHAVYEYARLSGDEKTFAEKLLPACRAIVAGYTEGTRYHIKVDPADGLVSQGDHSTQLTWMDAKCDGITFTPRQGKAVEINALWYHALCLLNDSRAAKVADSFRKLFWLSPSRGLADVANESYRDESIRPNQIFAVSLKNSPLTRDQQKGVVDVVCRELLTPVGMRTLARSDWKYKGRYSGPQIQRDAAYHNGAVWPWPIGAFLDAYLRVNDDSADAQDEARRWLSPLVDHLKRACIGQISEIFEGDEPHRPVGCFAQAWSVAECLRLAARLKM